LDYPFDEDRESSKIKPISLKEHQIWENQFHELNTYSPALRFWKYVMLHIKVASRLM